MKFAMGFEVQLADPTVEREHRLIFDSVEQAIFGEQMGFDRIWAAAGAHDAVFAAEPKALIAAAKARAADLAA